MRSAWIASLSALFLFSGPTTALAICPEEDWRPDAPIWMASSLETDHADGLGGSGIAEGDDDGIVIPRLAAGDDDGIGGSGLESGDDDGIGGSGLESGDDDGIGGSGIVGTITGFGSICVNGLRVTYDDDVPVFLHDHPIGVDQLAVGQVVQIDVTTVGTETGAQAIARSIAVRHAVVGPVSHEGEALTVLGQRVRPILGASMPTLEMGQRVAVSGLRQSDGTIIASRIDLAHPDRPDAVRGRLELDVGAIPRVAGVRVAPLSAITAQAIGTTIALGRWDPDAQTLREATLVEASSVGNRSGSIDIEGYVHSFEGGELRVGESRVTAIDLPIADAESLERGASPSIESGQRVRVEALRGPGDQLQLQRIWDVPERELTNILTRPDTSERRPSPTGLKGVRKREGTGERRSDLGAGESERRGVQAPRGERPKWLPGDGLERRLEGRPGVQRPDGSLTPRDRPEPPRQPERPERPSRPERPERPERPRFHRPPLRI